MTRKTMGGRRGMVAASMVLCVGLLGACMLAGCASGGSTPAADGSSAAVETSAVEASSVAAVPETPAYSVEAGDAAASASFLLTNGIEAKITTIELAPIVDGVAGEFVSYPFTVGDSLAPAQEACIHYEADAASYDMRLTMMDGAVYTLHALPLPTVESTITVMVADGIAYATYMEAGEGIDTLLAEQEIAAAAAAAEAAAYEESYTDTYGESYDYSYDAGGYGGGAQSDDACVSDIVLR